ncbi:DUF5819 family protein [Streptomyces sp. TRM70308]|uniref:DUF5819 family protein n=1 Tax=Streptomyces sp. TRM70308 TaxID=3131932 RepID=UPI003D087C4B
MQSNEPPAPRTPSAPPPGAERADAHGAPDGPAAPGGPRPPADRPAPTGPPAPRAGGTADAPARPAPGGAGRAGHGGHAGHGEDAGDAGHGEDDGGEVGAARVLALPTGAKVVLVGVAAAVAVAVAAHLGAVFLHVAPSNTVSRQYDEQIDDYIYPEFEQNWKLFAPNPLQQNVAVHARAEVRAEDGGVRQTGWVNLTAMDVEHIRGNPFPSHIAQNELRRAWDFYLGSHDDDEQPTGYRGELSESYLTRITLPRLRPELADPGTERVVRVQLRSVRRTVEPPPWSNESADTEPRYRVLPWWPVDEADTPEDAR